MNLPHEIPTRIGTWMEPKPDPDAHPKLPTHPQIRGPRPIQLERDRAARFDTLNDAQRGAYDLAGSWSDRPNERRAVAIMQASDGAWWTAPLRGFPLSV